MRAKVLSILSVFVVLLSSCWKGEEPFVLSAPSGGVEQQELTLGEDYDKIVYFNVNNREFLIRNLADWHLGFQAGEDELYVKMNTGNRLLIHETNLTDFTANYTIVDGMEWKYDVPSGNLDSTAIGKWWSNTNGESKKLVYVLDMGDTYTNGERYKKFQVEKADETGFWVKTGDLNDNTTNKDIFVAKDSKRNYSYLNIETNEVKTDLEPEKDNWDLLFTRYTYVFHDQGPEPIPYQVTGVLLNPNGVVAYQEDKKKFEDIDIDYALSINFSDADDVIGYDWKSFDIDAGRYTVNSSRTFIIKTISGYYYKMRFIDYYDKNGVKGTPVFDLQRL